MIEVVLWLLVASSATTDRVIHAFTSSAPCEAYVKRFPDFPLTCYEVELTLKKPE